ncbi:peptidoglycan-binding domain-containing protein [Streptomyces sp. NPDC086777]|uniref:peptidoglycan-binding domain-containing protein n=1 Tax=Streptomyces sp. NPDC086777 TaxID=3154866 RepID=UPI00344CB00A
MRRNRLLTSAAALGAAVALGPALSHTAAASPGQNCSYVAAGFQPTLGYGASGAAVRQAQCLSNAWSGRPPRLTTDGIYGTATQQKIEWIQTCHGLPASGVVEGRTWHVLYHPALDCYVPYPS